MQLSLAITCYNRFPMVMESFKDVLDDERISEIVISDDCSEESQYDELKLAVKDIPKIKLHRNFVNIGMMANKRRVVELCSNEFVILFDSDNSLSTGYIDAIEKEGDLKADTFYMPSFSMPQFDFRQFEGNVYDKNNIKELLSEGVGEVCCNQCNMVVNKEEYLKIYQANSEIKGTDTLWVNLLWLKAGNKLKVVPNMYYYHRVWEGSEFLKECAYNMAMAKKLKNAILQLT